MTKPNKDLENLSDDDHSKRVIALLSGHAKAVPQYDRHANKHLYKRISTPDEEKTVGELIDDGTLQTSFRKLLEAYLKTANLGENAQDYLTDISINREELERMFAGRLGQVYGPEEATAIKNRLMEKLRAKLTQSVDFSLGNMTDMDKLKETLGYLIKEGQLEDDFPSWKKDIVHYDDRAKQIAGAAIDRVLARQQAKGKHHKVYDREYREAA